MSRSPIPHASTICIRCAERLILDGHTQLANQLTGVHNNLVELVQAVFDENEAATVANQAAARTRRLAATAQLRADPATHARAEAFDQAKPHIDHLQQLLKQRRNQPD